jgi:integrase
MASIHRRFKSPFWVCEYRAADDRWLKRSTKLRDRHKAQEWCRALQEAEDRIRGGNPSEEQLRSIISSSMERITGSKLAAPMVREWLEGWLEGKEGANAPATLLKYKGTIVKFLAFLGPRAEGRLDAVTRSDVLAFRRLLIDEGRGPATVNLAVRQTLSAPFASAMRQGLIPHNPTAEIPRLIDKAKPRRQPFMLEEVRRLLAAASGDWRGAILCGFTTGMRLSDVANLGWEAIDFDVGVISFVQRKTDTSTVIGLHADFEEYLKSIKIRALTGPIFPGLAGRNTAGRSGLSAEFAGIMAGAGIQPATIRERQGKGHRLFDKSFHSFRHGAASHVFRGKVEETVKSVTGHRGESLRQYIHVDLQALRAATAMIPRISSSRA